MMKLLTKEILKKLPKLYSQEKESDPMVYVKFFVPFGAGTWYITEGEEQKGDFIMFGWGGAQVEREMGHVSLNEMKSLRGPFGLSIERDKYFTPCRLSEVKSGAKR